MAIILPDIGLILACVASVSVRFRSKGRGTRVKDRGKNFSRGQNRKSHSSVFFCSETKRKRLLRKLVLSTIYWQLNVITYLIIRLKFVFQGSNPILPLSIQSGVLFIGFTLQNSPYFCVLKYARAVKQKVWNKAENRERDWRETLKIRIIFFSLASHALRAKTLTPHFTDFFTDFVKKNRLFCSLRGF